jgi:hypothetical protein
MVRGDALRLHPLEAPESLEAMTGSSISSDEGGEGEQAAGMEALEHSIAALDMAATGVGADEGCGDGGAPVEPLLLRQEVQGSSAREILLLGTISERFQELGFLKRGRFVSGETGEAAPARHSHGHGASLMYVPLSFPLFPYLPLI